MLVLFTTIYHVCKLFLYAPAIRRSASHSLLLATGRTQLLYCPSLEERSLKERCCRVFLRRK